MLVIHEREPETKPSEIRGLHLFVISISDCPGPELIN